MAGEAPPLAGIRMVEWAEGLACSFAGFLLAALGADVVTIEAAGARRTSAASVLQRGKRSVDAACWDACVRGADVTLTDEAGPAVEAGDGLIACRVIAWGDAGAPRGLPPEEPLIAAMTGVQVMQWSWAGRPVSAAPRRARRLDELRPGDGPHPSDRRPRSRPSPQRTSDCGLGRQA